MNFKQLASYFFNWKANPASVFFIAIPLFIFGVLAHALYAYILWETTGDYVYSLIVLGGLTLFGVALWPIRKQLYRSLCG